MSGDLIARVEAVLVDHGWTITGGWLCNEVDECTCDGPFDTYGHRPECGLEPVWRIDAHPILGFAHDARTLIIELLAEVKRLQAAVSRARELAANPVQIIDDGRLIGPVVLPSKLCRALDGED